MAESSQTYFFAGGGTGGHLYPGIAVASAIVEKQSAARCVFLCTQREIDRTILSATPFEFIPQPIVPPVRTVNGLLKFWTRWRETKDLNRKLRREYRPAAVLGLGGYAAGVAVRYLATRKDSRGDPESRRHPRPGESIFDAVRESRLLPVRGDRRARVRKSSREIKSHRLPDSVGHAYALPAREEAAARLGLDPLLNTLVITGASQGAATVNDAVLAVVSSVKLQGWQILHLTGKEHAAAVRAGYREKSDARAGDRFHAGHVRCLGGRESCGVPIRREHDRRAGRLRRAVDPAALPVSQRHASACECESARRRRRCRLARRSKRCGEKRDRAEARDRDAALRCQPRRHAMSTAARSQGRRDAAASVATTMMEMASAGR